MANRQKICKGKKSDSSCTCDSKHECQEDTNDLKHDRNINNTTAYNKYSNECSTDCINCKLINRLYSLLEEIVENRKKNKIAEEAKESRYENDTGMPLKNTNEEIPKTKEHWTKLPNNDMDDKKCKIINVYNNNTGSNKLTLCDCDKTQKCCCTNEKEQTSVQKTKENKSGSSVQQWYSVGEAKKQNQVDCGCQCTCLKKDSSTQDYSMQEKNNPHNKNGLTKCDCIDSAVNTDTQIQNNSGIQNLFSSPSNEPMFLEIMKLLHGPNVVVLSNGCSCCNKCNTPLEKTSVTTNTSDIIVIPQDKNEEIVNTQELDSAQIYQSKLRESAVTFPKNIAIPMEPSINNEYSSGNQISNIKTHELNSISRSIKETPRQSVNNDDLLNDTTFMIPEETDYTVASAIIAKSAKKKATPKSKKRKNKMSSDSKELSNNKKDFINICCQTDKNIIEEKCEHVLEIKKKIKDEAVCCDLNKCNGLLQNLVKTESTKNIAIKHQNVNSCNCTDIRNFVAIITELCAQMNKNNGKPDEVVSCECSGKNTSTKTPAAPDDCLEIHRLAEKIAEIHLNSKQNKSGSPSIMPRNDFKRSVELVKSTNSDCDLTNCIHINPVNIASDNAEECYCNVCPCKKPTKNDICPVKKEKRGRCSINPTTKRATRKLNDLEYANLNKWVQEYPSASSQKCTCKNNECIEETEIGCINYNISGYSKDVDSCQMDTCPQLRRIIKDCLCGSKNCYCHNPKLNELRTTAKLERLADEVISTITPCNCLGQQCTCITNNNTNNKSNTMDPGIRRFTTRQVCFSSIYHENQRKLTNNTGKEKMLFDKDVNGNPCLNGSKSETKLYIQKLVNTKPTNSNKASVKKLIPSSTKKLRSLKMKPLLPIPDTPCTQINCINSLFPEIYEALSKIKQLTNWESLPQEIVEIVIDKILKREIKNALKQMTDGVFKISAGDVGDNIKDTNILNILLEDKIKSKENVKEFKNNIVDNHSEHTIQSTQHFCTTEKPHETINLIKDSNNNIQSNLETFDGNENNFDTNMKPILVQINIEKEKSCRKCNKSSISLSQERNKIFAENSCASINGGASSIFITENKLGSIINLTSLQNNNQNWEDNESDASNILSVKEAKQPISININIQMEKERILNLKDSFMNTDAVKPKNSKISSLSKESTSENTQTNTSKELEKSNMGLEDIRNVMDDLQEKRNLMDELQEKKKSMDDLQKMKKSMDDLQKMKKSLSDLQENKKSIVDFQKTNCIFYHENKSDLPSLEDFLAMNRKMKVQKFKITPKKNNKTK